MFTPVTMSVCTAKGRICAPLGKNDCGGIGSWDQRPDGLRRKTSISVPREKAPATSSSAGGETVLPFLSWVKETLAKFENARYSRAPHRPADVLGSSYSTCHCAPGLSRR